MELIFLLRVMLVAELRASGYIKNRSHNDIRCLNGHSEIWTAVKAAVLSGLYPNLAHYSPINGNVVVENQIRSQFHFCSTLLAQEGRNNGLGAVALDGPTSGNGVCDLYSYLFIVILKLLFPYLFMAVYND
jgi:hypothetical protein